MGLAGVAWLMVVGVVSAVSQSLPLAETLWLGAGANEPAAHLSEGPAEPGSAGAADGVVWEHATARARPEAG